jgi:transcriptional regulator with XRE-family HTH domain
MAVDMENTHRELPGEPSPSENLALGEHIKARRQELGLGLRELARATGLSATFVGSLERGMANPTLDTLRKIAAALDTPLSRLLLGSADRTPVVRRSERRHMTFPPVNVSLDIITPDLTHKMVLFEVSATAADGNLVGIPLREPTEECILVLAGALEVVAYGQIYELSAGDSIYLEGWILESIRVIGAGEARFVSAMTPPAF